MICPNNWTFFFFGKLIVDVVDFVTWHLDCCANWQKAGDCVWLWRHLVTHFQTGRSAVMETELKNPDWLEKSTRLVSSQTTKQARTADILD